MLKLHGLFDWTVRSCILALTAFLVAPPASATSTVILQPGSAVVDSSISATGLGLVSRSTGELILPNGTVSAQASADDRTGVARVSVSMDLSGSDSETQAFGASSLALISGNLLLVGPGSAPVPLRIAVEFDGYFAPASGSFQALIGTLSVGTSAIAAPTSNTFTSQVAFNYQRESGFFDISRKGTVSRVNPLTGVLETLDEAAAAPVVLSQSPASVQGALAARLQVDLLLAPGTLLIPVLQLNAIISLANPLDESGLIAGPGFGGVNAFDTARFVVSAPEGYLLQGTSEFLAAAVPEPSSFGLLALGLLVLAGLKRAR